MKAGVALATGLGLMLGGCIAGPARVTPDQLDTPVRAGGIEVLPPRGPDWYTLYAGGPAQCVVLYHKLAPDRALQAARGHTYAAAARCGAVPGERHFATVEEFSAFNTEMIRTSDATSARLRLLRWSTVPDPARGPMCVRYETQLEDRGVPGRGSAPFLISAHGYRCLHPLDPSIVVDISTSERRLEADPAWNLDDEVQPFLDNIRFVPLPRTLPGE